MESEAIEWAKLIFDFLKSLLWPVTAIAISLIFRSQIRDLVRRIKSGEVAGAKFHFQEAASGYIESKVEQLAKEENPLARAGLADEIKGVAAVLGGTHPIALSILIEAAQGLHSWVGMSYTSKKKYFDSIEEKGLATVQSSARSDGQMEYSLNFTPAGISFINSIGMIVSPDVIKYGDRNKSS